MRPRLNLVVGIDPEGNRFERHATNSDILFGFGRWGWPVLMSSQQSPVIVDGYTVWVAR